MTDLLSPAVDRETELKVILVPLDGSRLAETALGPTLALAQRSGAGVTLLHVLEHEAPETIHGERHLATESEAAAYLTHIGQRFSVAGVPVETHVHANPERDVPGSIVDHAAELGTDLIVLAAHGKGGLRGFLSGRVAEQVLRRGSRPMLLVQVGEAVGPLVDFSCERIAVLLDGTEEATYVMPLVLPVARAFGAALHLVAAVPTVGALGSERSPSAMLMPTAARAVLDLEYDNLAAYLASVAEALRNRGISVTTAVVRGEPADAVVAEAERIRADLLAFATHGRSGLSGIWSGSLGAKVLTRFKRPLLLARVPEDRHSDRSGGI
jgi:nucleotide-binding universal stress UspA family protein